MKGLRLWVVAAVVAVSLGAPRPARAEYAENAGWGVLSVIANLGYMPVKVVYATLGGLTGGLAYACTGGNFDTASSIWEMSLGGTYVLTPAMIRGEDPIAFAGESATQATERTVSEAPPVAPPSNRSRREDPLPTS